jgi:hypothetical protein
VGVWGSGLYSGDFAADLRAAVAAVSRLPFEGDKLAEILSGIEAGAANNPNDEDHTTFWLILADQFAKRGIPSKVIRDKALEIIDTSADLAMLEKLGMKPADLKKRQAVLTALRSRIAAPFAEKRRPVLRKPQAFVMEAGDVLVYPTSKGHCINSYFPSKERMIPKWAQDGWSATVIVETERAFDFLAWYRPATVENALPSKPELKDIHSASPWFLRRPGTCSPTHFKRMELEKIGSLKVDASRLKALFPNLRPGTSKAINDVSIANELSVRPYVSKWEITSSIAKLEAILS